MKQLDLIYSPENVETYIFNNLDLSKTSDPLYIEREEPIQEEDVVYEKKKSEVIEYENEEYMKLLEIEQEPYIITDSESRSMCGKFQNMTENSGMYFAFINTGRSLRVVPISKWYRFVQRNQVSDVVEMDGLEKNLNVVELDVDESESEHEIDFEEKFDDDDEDENKIAFEKEIKLSSSGKKLQGLMDNLEENNVKPEKETEENETEKIPQEESPKKIKLNKQNMAVTNEDISKVFGNKKITIKELLKALSAQFKLEENDKVFIRTFLKKNCDASIDSITGETVLKLKK